MQNGHQKPDESGAQPMRKLFEDVAAKSRALFNEALEQAREKFDEKSAVLKQKATDLGVDDLSNEMRSYIRRNPWRSVAIAAGVGFIAALVLKPRRKVES